MTEVPQHPTHLHFSQLPPSTRALYTAVLLVLGLAYLFGGIYLYHTYAGRAGGHPMVLSHRDIAVAYGGSREASRLESALKGPMRDMLQNDEVGPILAWIHSGAERAAYDRDIRPTIEQRCMACHDGSNPHLTNFANFDNLRKLAQRDTGTNIFTLVRVSHIHLFGLTMVFFILGTIFSHAHLRRTRLKSLIIVTPFAALVADIAAWYLTKLFPPFAWLVIAGGMLMGLAFGFMWLVSLWQLWVSPAPQWALGRTRRAAASA
jgi:hypothetical protein